MIAFIQKVLNQKYKPHKYKIYNEKNYFIFDVIAHFSWSNGTVYS